MLEQDRIHEENRLQRTLEEIDGQLKEKQADKAFFAKNMRTTLKNMWEEVEATPNNVWDPEQYIQAKFYLDEMRNIKSAYQGTAGKLLRLEKMKVNPYFARIDFMEDGDSNTEEIYIGITMVQNEQSLEILVYDWRAPISGMFYDYDVGPAKFESPAGTIKGELTLKRQLRIRNGRIEVMFDSAVKIDDEILQELLGQSKDERMKNIVTSIQREQNLAIRDEGHKLLIVEGPAGSGKTSIALHRIAFLLYRYRNSITNANVVIFSPNEMFNDYISDVLPELGEENVRQTTFMEYARSFLKTDMKMYDMNQQMEFILTARDNETYAERIRAIRCKSSVEFLSALKKYIENLIQNPWEFEDFTQEQVLIISGEEQQRLFHNEYTYLPLVPRLKKVKNRILYLIKQRELEKIQQLDQKMSRDPQWMDTKPKDRRSIAVRIVLKLFEPHRKKARSMGKATIKDYYAGLYREENLSGGIADASLVSTAALTLKRLGQNVILYEDLAPMLYLKGRLYGISRMESIRQVIIDEVQDYTSLQMEIIQALFPSSQFTVVGDLNQSINPYANIGQIDVLKEIFHGETPAHIRLGKSYRSTREITRFCRAILGMDEEYEFVNRSGVKPNVRITADIQGCVCTVAQSLHEMLDAGYKSAAVICRTRADAEEIFEHLHQKVPCHLVAKADTSFPKGVSILPSYLAKGLEFDAAYILNLDQPYKGAEERNLFYTVCTRALHRLFICSIAELPEYFSAIPETLYETD
ncbi:MAG: AAA family ATPase [Thermoclostridium sp.]|nr:AAA family ATPase [Thermoclostridium sp.]